MTMLRVATFRASPADLPYSQSLAGIWVAVYLAAGVVRVIAIGDAETLPVVPSLLVDVLSVLFLAGTAFLVLGVVQKTARWLQTFMALVGSQAILLWLLVWPQVYFYQVNSVELFILLMFGTMIAGVAIMANILRLAMEKPFAIGLLYAVLAYMLGSQLLITIVPPT